MTFLHFSHYSAAAAASHYWLFYFIRADDDFHPLRNIFGSSDLNKAAAASKQKTQWTGIEAKLGRPATSSKAVI